MNITHPRLDHVEGYPDYIVPVREETMVYLDRRKLLPVAVLVVVVIGGLAWLVLR